MVFELKRINELKVSLPTNEQLVSEADLRIWLDDLEETESEPLDTRGVLLAHTRENRARPNPEQPTPRLVLVLRRNNRPRYRIRAPYPQRRPIRWGGSRSSKHNFQR